MWRCTTTLRPLFCQNVPRVRLSSRQDELHTSQNFWNTPSQTNSGSVERADTNKKGPIKFTESDAHLNYKAVRNFYGDDRDLPVSHNYVLAASFIFGIYYLLYLRDDIEHDGGIALIKPLHESMPDMAIPLLEVAIAENKKFGNDTRKLEKKLDEYMKEPEKHGRMVKRRLIDN